MDTLEREAISKIIERAILDLPKLRNGKGWFLASSHHVEFIDGLINEIAGGGQMLRIDLEQVFYERVRDLLILHRGKWPASDRARVVMQILFNNASARKVEEAIRSAFSNTWDNLITLYTIVGYKLRTHKLQEFISRICDQLDEVKATQWEFEDTLILGILPLFLMPLSEQDRALRLTEFLHVQYSVVIP